MTGLHSDLWHSSSQELPSLETVGAKAYNLARLRQAGAEVPAWIAVRAEAFGRLVLRGRPWPHSIRAAEALRQEVLALELPEEFRAEVLSALEAAGLRWSPLAVRSSAVQEDGVAASFAGQFESVLGVRAGEDGVPLFAALRRVWASAFSAHAAAYQRQQHGGGAGGVSMAVILQQMVDAEVAGVAFSADPVTADRETVVVNAVYGLGEGLVSGALDGDTYRISFAAGGAGKVERDIVWKERALRMQPEGGTGAVAIPVHLWDLPALCDEEAQRIAVMARRLEAAFGAAQDLEWALAYDAAGPEIWNGWTPRRADRRLLVLQTRPITTLPPIAPASVPALAVVAGGERRIWDNSNIIESYSGVTTPLTFSFARGVYEEVYLQFCRLMGVSEPLLAAYREVFAGMLGLVQGRVYYNLLNWYRVLALLPGYSFNRAFMERMMGVREKLADPPPAPPVAGRWEDLSRLVRMAVRLAREQRRLQREVPAFHARVEAALAPLAGEDLTAWSAEELIARYRRLEESLLRHWKAPLVNDFFAMIFFGLLVRLTEKWLPDLPPALVNDLLCGEGEMISTEPARRVMQLARTVAETPELSALLASELGDAALWERLASEPRFAALHSELRAYLERFGERCMNELKLETVTLAEDPTFLLQILRALVRQGVTDAEETRSREAEIRRAAEATVRGRISGVRRGLFFRVLRQARRRVRDRENLRFERTRVFGVVRRIFLGLGGHLAARRRIASARDVFYLTVEEVFAHFAGTAVTSDLKGLVALRRAEFEAYGTGPAPPDRFETLGPPVEFASLPQPGGAGAAEGAELQGMGCCPGVVRAPVRIVRDPRAAGELAGCILVAERTDPGWTLLFPAVRGLLVQRGSLLSHSAIVAREMALPCVVGVPRLLETLREGELVEMDGTTGRIRRLADARGSAYELRSTAGAA